MERLHKLEDWRHSVPSRIGRSNLLPQLAKFYAFVPSAIIFRVPEAEILRAVPMIRPTLDLCCGDGFFASLISSTGFDAHCYYLSKSATRFAMLLDYHFSRVYLTTEKTIIRRTIRLMHRVPAVWPSVWRLLFARVGILSGDQGGGILIVSEK